MSILVAIIVGLIIGVLARFLMPGRDAMGFVLTAILGIVGSLLGGWLGRALGFYAYGEPAGLIMSIIGAMIVLFIYRLIMGRPKHTI